MPKPRTWTLTDVKRQKWIDELFIGHDELGVPDATVAKRTLRGGLRDGVDLVTIHNGELSFSVLPTRGMGIWKGSYRDIPLGWNAPIQGPVHPGLVNLQERGGLGWLHGFDEWICRCGLDSMGAPGTDVIKDNNGNESEVELTLHGRIANLPAQTVEIEADPEKKTVSVTGEVDESAMFCPGLRLRTRITTSALSNRLTIVDEVVNLKGTPSEFELLFHCNFAEPFLGKGARLIAPVAEVAPRDPRAAEGIDEISAYRAPTPGYVEQVYFYTLHADPSSGKTLVALVSPGGDQAAVLRYDPKQLPCFTQWKNTIPATDGYVTGLEPGTNYPLPKRVERERGRVITLPPGGTHRCELEVEIRLGRDEVSKLEREVSALASGRPSTTHREPHFRF